MALQLAFLRRFDSFELDCLAVHPLVKLSFQPLEFCVFGCYLALHALELLFSRGCNGVDTVSLFVVHHVSEERVFLDQLGLCLACLFLEVKIVAARLLLLLRAFGHSCLAHHLLHVCVFVELELAVVNLLGATRSALKRSFGFLPFKLLFIKH